MTQIQFNIDRCKGCGLCVEACPRKAIKMSEHFNAKGVHYACIQDVAKCSKCGMCFRMCPDIAIEIEPK